MKNKMNVIHAAGIGITASLTYKFVFELVNFVNYMITITTTNSDVCFIPSLRNVILKLLVIVFLPTIIQYASNKIVPGYRFAYKTNLHYILMTFIIMQCKVLLEGDLLNNIENALNFILIFMGILYLIKLKNLELDNIVIIIKSFIVFTFINMINSSIYFIININSGYIDYIVKSETIDLIYLISLLLILIALIIMKKDKISIYPVLLISIYLVIPDLIASAYRILILIVDYIKLANPQYLIGDMKVTIIYSLPAILLTLTSSYLIKRKIEKEE